MDVDAAAATHAVYFVIIIKLRRNCPNRDVHEAFYINVSFYLISGTNESGVKDFCDDKEVFLSNK